ncbi:hypothetical protein Tco_0654604 [Tanacetum coccineum]|uniref:Uncharacterized protein n=1 Tax=Tanacetum coccineum TaxID=301880 RepID=A0ABQ4X3S4_9ASTR
MSKVLHERGFGSLPSSTEMNPRDQDKSISTTIEADSYSISHTRSSQYAKKKGSMDQNLRKLMELHISITSYLKRRKTEGVSLYLALLINFGIKRLLDDLRVTAAKLRLQGSSSSGEDQYKWHQSLFAWRTFLRRHGLRSAHCGCSKSAYASQPDEYESFRGKA